MTRIGAARGGWIALAITLGLACGALTGPSQPAAALEVLGSFDEFVTGRFPIGGRLVFGPDGALYGTAQQGGSHGSNSGTVFRIAPPASGNGPWTLTALYHFKGAKDGWLPEGGVVFGPDGSLYGTASGAGSHGFGTVFKLSPPTTGSRAVTWKITPIHQFGRRTDGRQPRAALVFDPEGSLYGTTYAGGKRDFGTVFKLVPPQGAERAWTAGVIHHFNGAKDGRHPQARLVRGPDGALYGTASAGGKWDAGTVFKLDPPAQGHTSWTMTPLHHFRGTRDGMAPVADLAVGPDGVFYGTASEGGKHGGGTAFRLTPPAAPGEAAQLAGWSTSVIRHFGPGGAGYFPHSGLAIGEDGALYGANALGGTSDVGTVFKLIPPAPGGKNWKASTLLSFAAQHGGQQPRGGLIWGQDGALYGITSLGGEHGGGTVFRVTPP